MKKVILTASFLMLSVSSVIGQFYFGSSLGMSFVKDHKTNTVLVQPNTYMGSNMRYVFNNNYQVGIRGGFNDVSVLDRGILIQSVFTDLGAVVGMNLAKDFDTRNKLWFSAGLNYRLYEDTKLSRVQKGNRLGVMLSWEYEYHVNKIVSVMFSANAIRDLRSSHDVQGQYFFQSLITGIGVDINVGEHIKWLKKKLK